MLLENSIRKYKHTQILAITRLECAAFTSTIYTTVSENSLYPVNESLLCVFVCGCAHTYTLQVCLCMWKKLALILFPGYNQTAACNLNLRGPNGRLGMSWLRKLGCLHWLSHTFGNKALSHSYQLQCCCFSGSW